MSNATGDSSGSVANVEGLVIRSRCWCGNQIVLRKSKTAKNPNRWFYRCELAANQKLKGDNHHFQWVDDGNVDESVHVKVSRLQQDVRDVKLVLDHEKQLQVQLEMRVQERIDEAIEGVKSGVRRAMFGYFFLGCMVSLAISKFHL